MPEALHRSNLHLVGNIAMVMGFVFVAAAAIIATGIVRITEDPTLLASALAAAGVGDVVVGIVLLKKTPR